MDTVDKPATTFLHDLERTIETVTSERQRKHERLEAAQRAFDAEDQKLIALARTREIWLELHPDERPVDAADSALLQRFRGLSTREMLVEMAKDQGGILDGSDVAQSLVLAGLFRDIKNASSNVYAALSRSPDLFVRIGRGRYRLRSADAPEDGNDDGSMVGEPVQPPTQLIRPTGIGTSWDGEPVRSYSPSRLASGR